MSILARPLAGLILALGISNAQGPAAAGLEFERYTLKTFDGREQEAEAGRITVAENREDRSGRRVQVALVRLRSRAAEPGPPIVFLAGGPGVPGSGMARVPVYAKLFERLREVSDVILLDQRGTGMSSPSLQCPAPAASAPPDALASPEKALEQLVRTWRACADHFRSQGVELAAYNPNAVADDLDDLRRALGVEKLNLLGVSYGTHLGLATIRRHGKHVHRAVLAGVMGPDHTLQLPGTTDSLLKKISWLAGQDAAVREAVPDLDSLVRSVLDRLGENPVTLDVTDKRTGRLVSVSVGKFTLQVLLRGMSDDRTIPGLPAFFHSISRGDYSQLAPRIEQLYNSLGGAGNSAMSAAMSCSSGWSAERLARVESEARRSLAGNSFNLQLRPEICRLLGSKDPGPEFRPPVRSTVPTLFVSGGLDGITPPFQAEEVRWGFPSSAHLIVENLGHETLPAADVQSAVVDFFQGADVGGRPIVVAPPRFLPVEQAKPR